MDTKSHAMKWKCYLIGVVLLGFLTHLSSCFDSNCRKFYAFEFPLTVTPKDTFTIGDTIWWEMDVPNQVLDHNTGNYIDITDFELYFAFFVSEIDSTQPILPISQVSSFIPVESVGHMEYPTGLFQQLYFRTASITEKRFRLGFIPTKVGTYDTNTYWPWHYTDNQGKEDFVVADPWCREYITQESTVSVNDKQTNFYFLQGICNTHPDGTRVCYTPDQAALHQTNGSYAFHVKAP